MRILLIEDIYLQGEWLETQLASAFRCEIRWVKTASEFQSQLDDIGAWSPDLALVDVMLKWSEPRPDMAPPPPTWSRTTAGIECQRLLGSHPGTGRTQVILYTILSRKDLSGKLPQLPAGVSHLVKDADLEPLFQRIREVTGEPRRFGQGSPPPA
jgi:hypothetical protein